MVDSDRNVPNSSSHRGQSRFLVLAVIYFLWLLWLAYVAWVNVLAGNQ